ncbi:hypothetical protein ACWCPF_32575 [Streptomyces sp. NPDC001858]
MSTEKSTTSPSSPKKTVARSRRGAKLGFIALIALVVAVHLGLGGLLLVSGPWRHWAVGAVLAAILAKAAFVLGRLVIRRNKARKAC